RDARGAGAAAGGAGARARALPRVPAEADAPDDGDGEPRDAHRRGAPGPLHRRAQDGDLGRRWRQRRGERRGADSSPGRGGPLALAVMVRGATAPDSTVDAAIASATRRLIDG